MEFALSIAADLSAHEGEAICARDNDETIVPIPALLIVLTDKEREKGAPLTRREVESIRDRARCMKLPRSVARALQARRGYSDIDRDNCWEDWLARRSGLQALVGENWAASFQGE